jgi:hypothetical protein
MDKQRDQIVAALKEAANAPEPVPLYKVGKHAGLFAAKGAAAVAEQALRDGLLEVVPVPPERRGKSDVELVQITPRGREYLVQHESPKVLLEEVLSALRSGQAGLPKWCAEWQAQILAMQHRFTKFVDQQTQALDELRQKAEAALARLHQPPADTTLAPWQLDALTWGRQMKCQGSAELTFADLYRHLRATHPELTVTLFHSGLLELADRRLIELRPPQVPLDEVIEPELALLQRDMVFTALRWL